jgi:hypothetical protein
MQWQGYDEDHWHGQGYIVAQTAIVKREPRAATRTIGKPVFIYGALVNTWHLQYRTGTLSAMGVKSLIL